MYLVPLNLTEEQRQELEIVYRTNSSRLFVKRCHLILLKGKGRTNRDIASILDMNENTVGSWIKRYESEGIEGLKTRSGQGRKPILDPKKDAKKVRKAVRKERQRLSKAKDKLEKKLNKKFSIKTLQRFLKNLTAATNGYA